MWREMRAMLTASGGRGDGVEPMAVVPPVDASDEEAGADDASSTEAAGTSLGEGWVSPTLAACVTAAHAVEACRGWRVELHAVSALLGGVAAQEAVKLLTGQYLVVENTFVYNGVAGVGAVYNL